MARVRKAGVLTPAVFLCDVKARKIFMEYLGDDAMTLKDFIRGMYNFAHPAMNVLAAMIGESLANMHKGDNIHGDLTTSNMMIKSIVPSFGIFGEKAPTPSAQDLAKTMSDKSKAHLYLIDFGLSFVSNKVEDKATDIYVLKRAFLSTHPNSEDFFEKVLTCY